VQGNTPLRVPAPRPGAPDTGRKFGKFFIFLYYGRGIETNRRGHGQDLPMC